MATSALDIGTVLVSLQSLARELGSSEWLASTSNPVQEEILTLLERHLPELSIISGLKGKGSRSWEALNAFLVENNFDPMVQPFDPVLGAAVVTILDKLVEWAHGPGEPVQIRTRQGQKTGFELPAKGAKVYQVEGFVNSFLVEVATTGADTLWLFMPQFESEWSDVSLGSFSLAQQVMAAPRAVMTHSNSVSYNGEPVYGKVRIPMVEFDIKPDLSWLLGLSSVAADGEEYRISQAKQQFKFRMNEYGARAKVATVVGATRGISMGPKTLIIDQPFFGWFIQSGVELPLATFFADFDCWQQPSGSLRGM